MSKTRNCVCRHPNRHILISLLFLLVSSLTHYTIPLAQGRSISGLIQAQQKSSGEVVVVGEKIGRQIRQIGSRPPRCERRGCSGCARCVAVQVPVAPQHRFHMQFISKTNSISSNNNNNNVGTKYVYPLGGDDFSNYKPMSWKCKCGNFLFNP